MSCSGEPEDTGEKGTEAGQCWEGRAVCRVEEGVLLGQEPVGERWAPKLRQFTARGLSLSSLWAKSGAWELGSGYR